MRNVFCSFSAHRFFVFSVFGPNLKPIRVLNCLCVTFLPTPSAFSLLFFRHRSSSTVFEKRSPKNSGQSIAADFLLERQSISRLLRVLFCSFVLFRFCTSDTGSGMGNGQRGGPSVRRKWTSGRGYAQMPVGLLIVRVFLPLLSFFFVFALQTPFHT